MYKLPKKEDVNAEGILEYLSEEQIFERFLGIEVQYRSSFCSPLRKDERPTCRFFIGRNNKVMLKDFAGHFFGDCFALVMYIYGCTYIDALAIIDKEFDLGLYSIEVGRSSKPKAKKDIRPRPSIQDKKQLLFVPRKQFVYQDRAYWGRYGITEELLRYYGVFPVQRVLSGTDLEGYNTVMEYDSVSPLYGYYLDDTYKFYKPLTKNGIKWLSNTKSDILQGYRQIPKDTNKKIGIITKSLKDVMVLYTLGIWSAAPQSENTGVPTDKIAELKKMFTHLIILFDNDGPGIEGAKKLSDIEQLPYVYLPVGGHKDISDYREAHTHEETVNLMKNLLKDYL